jgi:DNA-binding CsgD family transcriptional regulator
MARPPLSARPPTDPAEERTLRKLANARHAPASLIQRARIITASWDGASVPELAERLGCHPKTVYKWLHRFNDAHGLDGLADLPARACLGASPRPSAAGSSPWPARRRPAACTRAARDC